MKKLFVIIISLVIMFVASVSKASAFTAPSFPVCANPLGSVIASHDSGTHGVPGDNTTYTGKDTVYSLGNDSYMQCLCADSGQGIQTNWVEIYDMSEDDIKIAQSQGWIFVPQGDPWGLDGQQYLAKNMSFTCPGGGSSNSNSGGSGDGHSDGKSDGLGGGFVYQTGQVLGLASTGNSGFILGVITSGLLMVSSGFLFNKRDK